MWNWVNENLASVEIEKMVEGPENVIDDCTFHRNVDQKYSDIGRARDVIGKVHEISISRSKSKSKFLSRVKVQVLVRIPYRFKNAIDTNIPSLVDASVRSYMFGHILHVHPAQPQTTFVPEQQYQLYLSMKADPQLQQQDIAIWLALQMKFETLQVPQTTCRTSVVRPRDQDDPHDDAHLEGENSAKRQKTSEYEAYVTGESSGQVNKKEQGQSTSRKKEHIQMIMIFGLKGLKKIAGEMLDKDKGKFSSHSMKDITFVQSCQGEILEALALSMINQDLLYLKKNPHAKIFYIKMQKEPGKPKEVVFYRIQRFIQTGITRLLGTGRWKHKFITRVVAKRRANEHIVSITKPNYKNLNKNDIEDMYLLIMNGKECYQLKVNLAALLIFFPGIDSIKRGSLCLLLLFVDDNCLIASFGEFVQEEVGRLRVLRDGLMVNCNPLEFCLHMALSSRAPPLLSSNGS
ncbi:hypothetical protein Tco_0403953 [Tanacetum coccineum]